MSTNEKHHREQLAARVAAIWGPDRVEADAALIDSASAALARLAALQPVATADLDADEEPSRD